jgi:SAM-dependent methyltransferase
MHRSRLNWLVAVILAGACFSNAEESQRSTNRSDALKVFCRRLNVGRGAVVADVGCGDGRDSLVFAGVVGDRGTVLAQEIDAAKLKKVVEATGKRGFHQVVPVLGQSEDPRLPDGLADLIYLNRVFHHFSQPRAMLERMWFDLKVGGFLVIVDQQKGPLADWAPMEGREKKHHWTAETTVVRLAREAGFLFHDVLDELWHEEQPFVLVFRRPLKATKPEGDPDLPRPLDARKLVRTLPLNQLEPGASVIFVGLDRGRAVAPALKAKLPAASKLFDVIIDEWALSREELPPAAPLAGVEIIRTEKGRLALPVNPSVGLVILVDAYHRLWEPVSLLKELKERMSSSGVIAVVERKGPHTEARHMAGHRRRLSSSLVVEDMRQVGFQLRRTLPAPASDRYSLLFEPQSPAIHRQAGKPPTANPGPINQG